ncbi:thiamine ABC transporter substrate-binding protein [Spirochaeta africana]|uniref:ABC transporter periplasmic binding protein, thiB subfamily n=1 Tax=Spirochaeta africana (strain ATCC 700263 / DSM 8902 / Z-7692) TaxID=889378 RepID=H9UM94_SPIAZ|nr:thiamine ABC transporter substrate-binding protein [Spirochaeta africana]AFG38637.1 ABC transporter periplasmic binding protein, thiB subfamily [Spirochaeta africana DSM 8902]
MKVLVRILLAAVLTAGLLAACDRTAEEAAADIEARRGETDQVVIYGYDSLPGTLRRAIVEHMEREYGVEVDLQRIGDTGAVFTQLYLERSNPQADVVIGLDESYLPRLRAENMLEPYEPADLQLVRDELLVDPEYYAVPFDFGYITLNADMENLERVPESWEDLLSEDFRNSFIMLNPGTSSPGRNFLLYTIAVFGEDDWLDFWQQLQPNILTVTSGWSDGYGLYTQGEAPLVVSYETSPAFHRHFEETDRYQAVLFDDAAYLQVEVAGIVHNARNRLNAERVMDFLVSQEFQELIPLNQIMYPIHPGVELPEAFTAGASVENAVSLDPQLVGDNFSTWLMAWEDVLR